MNHNEAKEEVKNRLADYLQQQGLPTNKAFRCLNPEHEDKNPSMSYDKENQKVTCFSQCNKSYDLLDLIGFQHQTSDFKEQLEIACSRFNIPLNEDLTYKGKTSPTTAPTKPAVKDDQAGKEDEEKARKARAQITAAQANAKDPKALEYLQKRGISEATAERYSIGYLPSFFAGNNEKWQALIIPTGEASLTARNLNSDQRGNKVRKAGKASCFNLQALESDAKAVYIVEGEIDALSVIEAGGQAVALCSTADVGKLLANLSHSKTLESKTLILSLDNDEAGLKAAQELREGIIALNKEGKKIPTKTLNISGDYKDPNEAWLKDPQGFSYAVKNQKPLPTIAQKEDYRKQSAAARLFAFREGVEASADTPAIPTGFKYLDNKLDGGLYEGLYTIAAISSLGKTTYVLQIAESIAQQGKDVLFISMEMAASELIAKSLSRLTFTITLENRLDRGNCKTLRGITDGKRYERYSDAEHALIKDAYEAYYSYADHLYIQEGLGDITAANVREAVEIHKAITGNTPVIFIDYLQILALEDPRTSDKQNMDKAVLQLKRLSRDFKTPVIVISSLNRDNYKSRINLAALKESGAIEYSSDVVIGLQLEGASTDKNKDEEWLDEKMKADPRKIEAVILKNRNGGRGESLHYDYYPMFNLFDESLLKS